MSIRDELLKWANDEQARGNPVSIQEITEHAQGLAQKQEAGAFRLLANIREAAEDPHGRLMQYELVDHIAELSKKAAERDALAAHVGRFYSLYRERWGNPGETDTSFCQAFEKIIGDEPKTSLAKLKVQCQIEEASYIIDKIGVDVGAAHVVVMMRRRIGELRRQAEEPAE